MKQTVEIRLDNRFWTSNRVLQLLTQRALNSRHSVRSSMALMFAESFQFAPCLRDLIFSFPLAAQWPDRLANSLLRDLSSKAKRVAPHVPSLLSAHLARSRRKMRCCSCWILLIEDYLIYLRHSPAE